MTRLPQVTVTEAGQGPGPAAVLLHGFLGSREDWSALVPLLRRRCRVVELPGHGVGAEPGRITFAETVSAVARVLARERGPVDLVGYSMGGRVAMAAALAARGNVRKLVVVSATPGIESGQGQLDRARSDDALADRLENGGLRRFLDDWYAQPLFRSLQRRPALLRALLSRRLQGHAAALAGALRGLTVGRQPSLWHRLTELQMPVLYIAGAEDARYAEILGRAAGLSPRGRLLIVAGAGHMPHLEQPDFFAAQVTAFLDS